MCEHVFNCNAQYCQKPGMHCGNISRLHAWRKGTRDWCMAVQRFVCHGREPTLLRLSFGRMLFLHLLLLLWAMRLNISPENIFFSRMYFLLYNSSCVRSQSSENQRSMTHLGNAKLLEAGCKRSFVLRDGDEESDVVHRFLMEGWGVLRKPEVTEKLIH